MTRWDTIAKRNLVPASAGADEGYMGAMLIKVSFNIIRLVCGVRGAGEWNGRGDWLVRRETRECSDGRALGIEAEMILARIDL